jgi:hypothetical protein
LFVPFGQFQNRILDDLLFDPFLERLNWQLEDFHRLDHPRSKLLDLLLAGFHPERQSHFSFHRPISFLQMTDLRHPLIEWSLALALRSALLS